MDIRVLGPLVAEEHGQSLVPSAGKPRQILALLALNADRMVTVSTLMEEIWGEAVPRSAATTLQTYILQLRRKIAEASEPDPAVAPKDVLVTQHNGYRLRLQDGVVDVHQFERLAAEGRAAFDASDDDLASDLFRRALDLWQGPALVDVPAGAVLELEVLRMDESRMATLERRIDVDLRLGRHSDVIPELRVLVGRHPMHENFCAQLMTALYRSGSAWRALHAYQQLRVTLIEELGLEPSPRLQRLQQAILAGDPELDLPATNGERLADPLVR